MEAILEAKTRDTFGKNEARRTRAAGLVPAVMYGASGGDTQATPISVEPKAFSRILHSESGANTLITLKLEGAGDTRVLVKEYQLDPITHALLHADFYKVAMDRALEVTIPVFIKGEPKGVKVQGGVLEFIRREIVIECLPADIPERVEIDVTDLTLNQGVRVRDVAVNAKWTPVTEPETMLVHVIAPRAEAAATTEPGAAPAEPEVIKKGKKEEEGADKDKKK